VIPVDERRRLSGQGRLGGPEHNDAESIGIVRLDPAGVLLVLVRALTPVFTMVGGRATHDPDKRLAP
jgi:hypothetical protein